MAASGRYKSRLLNYLVEQSHKLSDRAGHRLRQARTGMVWGAQVLLYPLYVAFQSSRVIGRRLSQGGPMPGQARLTPPRADDVVTAVMQLARSLADQGAITLNLSAQSQASLSQAEGASATITTTLLEQALPPKVADISLEATIANQPDSRSPAGGHVGVAVAPQPAALKPAASAILGGVDIRGVASKLGNRALVLVDNSNRVVPLESEQQWTLQQTIVQQVADFNYRRKRYSHQLALNEAIAAGQALPGNPPLSLPRPRTRQLAGLRWMTHLMGWMQTGDLAQSANLFQESQLTQQMATRVAAPPFLYWDPEPGQQLTRQTLSQLDSPLANWEQRYIQREQRDDLATQALRFTAKLFGLEEAAHQWLQASAAQTNTGNISQAGIQAVHQSDNGFSSPAGSSQIFGSQMPGLHESWASEDPWGDYTGQLPGQAHPGMPPQQLSSGQPLPSAQGNLGLGQVEPPIQRPKGWLGSLLNLGRPGTVNSSVNPAATNLPAANSASAAPKGFQRLTHRFSGLLKHLQKPAGPIAPLNAADAQAVSPATAPNNANLGLERSGQTNGLTGDRLQNNNTHDGLTSSPAIASHSGSLQGDLAQSGLSDAQIEAAWQMRVANAKAQKDGLKSKNVTLQSRSQGAQPEPASAVERLATNGAKSDSADGLQTAETAVTYESPYVETTASFNGYEKHPLELILERLDRILLWIEEQGLKLWRWLTKAGEQ